MWGGLRPRHYAFVDFRINLLDPEFVTYLPALMGREDFQISI